jgi:hypothetical protein
MYRPDVARVSAGQEAPERPRTPPVWWLVDPDEDDWEDEDDEDTEDDEDEEDDEEEEEPEWYVASATSA